MNTKVALSQVPPGTQIAQRLKGAYFHDTYEVEAAGADRTALGHFLAAVSSTPSWVEQLMRLRNQLVGLVGLKNLGTLGGIDHAKPETAYAPGDRVGVFTLRSNSPTEVVVADNDMHLEVLLSLVELPRDTGQAQRISLTTVVHVHNLLGRIYMVPVTPMHKLIARAVLARIAA